MVLNLLTPVVLIAPFVLLPAPVAIATDKFINPDKVVNLAIFEGTYFIKTQMIMPNLEENLRYAKATVTKCVRQSVPGDLFPILSHQSLKGCKLVADMQQKNTDHYTLLCTGTNQTQGDAQILKRGSILSGTVNIRMGGKNMTFSQRMVATRTDRIDELCTASVYKKGGN